MWGRWDQLHVQLAHEIRIQFRDPTVTKRAQSSSSTHPTHRGMTPSWNGVNGNERKSAGEHEGKRLNKVLRWYAVDRAFPSKLELSRLPLLSLFFFCNGRRELQKRCGMS